MRPEVAADQEVGDVLAEGLFWQLDEVGKIENPGPSFWDSFLDRRRRFIADVLHRIESRELTDPRLADRDIRLALKHAAARADQLTPHDCANYLEAWAADSDRWHRLWRQLPRGLSL